MQSLRVQNLSDFGGWRRACGLVGLGVQTLSPASRGGMATAQAKGLDAREKVSGKPGGQPPNFQTER